jgi:molybdopterin converting factor small subunit
MTHTTVRIPTPLRRFTNGADEVKLAARTVGEALEQLGDRHAGLRGQIFDANGEIRSFVNVFVGERHIRSREGFDTPLANGEVISIVPAVAGGTS